jgi:hypothetical protein
MFAEAAAAAVAAYYVCAYNHITWTELIFMAGHGPVVSFYKKGRTRRSRFTKRSDAGGMYLFSFSANQKKIR